MLLLDVVVNGHSLSQIGEFTDHNGVLLAMPAELHALGFAVAPGNQPVSLQSVAGLSARVDVATQTVYISATDAARVPSDLTSDRKRGTGNTAIEGGTGLVGNYDLSAIRAGGSNLFSGTITGRAYSPYGVIESDALVSSAGLPTTFVRLDTTYTHSEPGSLRQERVGDVINGGLSWTRPVRLGGLQVESAFGLRPDLITFPVPSLNGSVAVPSTVDVLVNGVEQFSRTVSPGPFQLAQAPVIDGAGMLSATVQDPSGRNHVLANVPFYASAALLKPGLAAYSLEIGAIRTLFGLRSDSYSGGAGSGTGRYGLLPWLTGEAHAEVTGALLMGGSGFAINVANYGVVTLDAAASHWKGRHGALASIGVERVTSHASIAISTQLASSRYADLATTRGQPMPRRTTRASAGLTLGRFGTLGVAYTDTTAAPFMLIDNSLAYQNYVSVSREGRSVTNDREQRSELVSATYSKSIRGIYAYVTGFYDLHDRQNTGVTFGLAIPLGPKLNAAVTEDLNDGMRATSVQLNRSVIEPGDVGGHAILSAGQPSRQLADVEVLTRHGLFDVGLDREAGGTSARLGAQGSVIVTDGTLFAANYVQDSFAVVDTKGTPGIGVLQENRAIGKTDSSGRFLLPFLRSFDVAKISLDPHDLALDADVGDTDRLVRPSDRSGVIVYIPIEIGRSAAITVVDAKGRPIPLGSSVTHTGEDPQPVGYGGEAYLRHLLPQNHATVTLPDGRQCMVKFTFKSHPGNFAVLGPFKCVALDAQ